VGEGSAPVLGSYPQPLSSTQRVRDALPTVSGGPLRFLRDECLTQGSIMDRTCPPPLPLRAVSPFPPASEWMLRRLTAHTQPHW
jgi:hypothetical protein